MQGWKGTGFERHWKGELLRCLLSAGVYTASRKSIGRARIAGTQDLLRNAGSSPGKVLPKPPLGAPMGEVPPAAGVGACCSGLMPGCPASAAAQRPSEAWKCCNKPAGGRGVKQRERAPAVERRRHTWPQTAPALCLAAHKMMLLCLLEALPPVTALTRASCRRPRVAAAAEVPLPLAAAEHRLPPAIVAALPPTVKELTQGAISAAPCPNRRCNEPRAAMLLPTQSVRAVRRFCRQLNVQGGCERKASRQEERW